MQRTYSFDTTPLFFMKYKIEFVFYIYGVPQKKFSLFCEHVGLHFLCLLQGIYVQLCATFYLYLNQCEKMGSPYHTQYYNSKNRTNKVRRNNSQAIKIKETNCRSSSIQMRLLTFILRVIPRLFFNVLFKEIKKRSGFNLRV